MLQSGVYHALDIGQQPDHREHGLDGGQPPMGPHDSPEAGAERQGEPGMVIEIIK
jgi:hypothetical protein